MEEQPKQQTASQESAPVTKEGLKEVLQTLSEKDKAILDYEFNKEGIGFEQAANIIDYASDDQMKRVSDMLNELRYIVDEGKKKETAKAITHYIDSI